MSPTMIDDNVLSWASELDDKTLDQAKRTARLPFVEKPLALMPDAHFGMGATIGSVIATHGAIIPAAVGVDIGCGMIAAETDLTASGLPDDLSKLHDFIAMVVPAGVGRGHDAGGQYPATLATSRSTLFTDKQRGTAHAQFGSLGSGNHFVEVCLDERDRVWVVLHSGSRGIGNQLATQHIAGAKGMMKRYFIDLEDTELAYLVEGTPEFDAYIADMLWAQEYAMSNRQAMMNAVLTQLWGFVGVTDPEVGHVVQSINCHHNFTERENHHGHNVWLTRKGAIRAREGDKGVIPGSMGTCSYIVSGTGNLASYQSCSHGAGRRMSRGQARKTLDVETLRESMKGKAWNEADAKALIDEDPRSYKDIDQVMADQKDLVTVEHELHQVLNYKGTDSPRRRR